MSNSHKFQNSFNEKDFNQELVLINHYYLYSLNYAILFEKKSDANNFLKKIKQNGFNLVSVNANLFRISITSTELNDAVLNANKFLEIAKKEKSKILTDFIC